LRGKKWEAAAVSNPPIKNSGERRDVLVFSGVGARSFSREEWPRMNTDEHGSGDGITGVDGAAKF
jgi:hypothetical protein